MRRQGRVRTGGLALLGLMLCAGSVLAAPGADHQIDASADSGIARTWWFAAGLGAGAVAADQDLADYRWSTDPAALYALQGLAGRDGWAAGLRFSRWTTTQGTGLAEAGPDPQVRLTQFEFVGQLRLVRAAGCQLWGSALVGRIGLSYTPDELVVASGGAGGDITVNYHPISETTLGVGLELRRDFGRSLAAALVAERIGFSLDTSHRRGAEIVSARDRFANWSLRLQFAWRWDLG